MTNKRLIEFGTILKMCGFRAMQIKPVRTVCTYKRVALDDMDLCNYDTCPIWAQLETPESPRLSSQVHDVDDFYREVDDE